MFSFGAGRARLIPAGGGQPVELGVVQSASLELKVDLKELRGPYRYPICVADGKGTASGKINFAQFWPQTLAAITGGTLASKAQHAIVGEIGTIPLVTTYTYTLAQGATLVAGSEVIGVIDATGNPVFYSRGTAGTEASSSVVGQAGGIYSISSVGVLTFVAADAGLKVIASYQYAPTTDINSNTVSLAQVGMNTATTFQLTLIGVASKNAYTNQAQQFLVQLNACIAPSLKMDFKLDDFTYVDLDFQAYCDASGNLGSLYMVNSGGVAAAA